MKTGIAIGIVLAILLLLVAVVAYSGYFEKTSAFELRFVDIEVENPKPSLLNDRAVTIDPGESVTLRVTVQNKGEAIIYRNDYCVGVEIVYPDEGAKYWKLPAERLIEIDMGPGGKSSYAVNTWNRKEFPFSGNFKIQAYIKSVQSGEKIARSDNVTIELKPPTSTPVLTLTPTPAETETSSPGFEAVFVIIGLMTVRYLIRRRV
ncbi:MAG: PGF-CTERM sorting domain-containing protein [Halobacteriota archaeon]